MGTLWSIIVFLLVGLVAGFIARAVVPGKDSMGIIPTIVLGLVGSIVGGLLWGLITGSLFRGAFDASGLIGSIIGAIIVLLVYNRVTGRKARR